MSTLAKIQDAVTKLGDQEKKALSLWLNSQIEPEMSAQEEQRLLHSLDEAIRDVDAGKGVPMEDVRKRLSSWAAKTGMGRAESQNWMNDPALARSGEEFRR